MINPIYTLPDMSFVGGESQTFLFNLLTSAGKSFNASDCTVAFAIVNYANKNGTPILIKYADIIMGEEGLMSIASEELNGLFDIDQEVKILKFSIDALGNKELSME